MPPYNLPLSTSRCCKNRITKQHISVLISTALGLEGALEARDARGNIEVEKIVDLQSEVDKFMKVSTSS